MNKVVLLLLLLLATPVFGAEYHLDWSATFSPPHNEPVVGNKVARYRAQLIPSFDSRWFSGSIDLQAWGVNTWRRDPGHGIGEWDGSDWTVEKWRVSTDTKVWFWPAPTKTIGIFSEYYMPIDRHTWGRSQSLSNYYWLVGFGGRIL